MANENQHNQISPKKEFFSPALPRFFPHRGLATEYAENTLAAFTEASRYGSCYVETDVHVSADNVAILCHDPSIFRLTGRKEMVKSLSSQELHDIDLGNGSGFCTLLEALQHFPHTYFNIDIKSDGAVQPTIEAILAAKATHRVLITSFRGKRRKRAVAALPNVATSASSAAIFLASIASRLRISALFRFALRSVDAVQVPEFFRGFRLVTPHFISEVHALGLEIHVWTVNDPQKMNRLLAAGVDGIFTDRIDLASKL